MTTFGSGITVHGELNDISDVAEYTVFLRAGEHYEVYLGGQATSGPGAINNPHLSITGLGEFHQDADAGMGNDSYLHFTPQTTGTYVITVGNAGSGGGTFDLNIADGSFETDIGDNLNTTTTSYITVNSVLHSRIDSTDDGDMVAVSLDAGVSYSIDARGSATGDGSLSDPFLEVFDEDGHRITLDDDSGAGNNAHLAFTSLQGGLYFIRVSGFGTTQGSYELQVSDPLHTGDNVAELPGASLPDLLPGSDIESALEFNGDRDGYHLGELVKGVLYQFDVVGTGGAGAALPDPFLELLDQQGNLVTFNDDGGANLGSRIFFLAPDSGSYTLRVGSAAEAADQTGTYTVSATILSSTPSTLHDLGSEQDASHHETITGSDGNDQLSGGVGDDTMNGGNGVDTLDYSGVLAPVNVNLVTGIASGPDIGFDHVSNFENVLGGAGADTVNGSSAANVLTGNGGNDQLVSGAGADVLDGGAGSDLLDGGADNDKLTGGDGKDTLDGGTGNDTMTGGAGDDFYTIDAGNDQVIEAAGGGVDTVITALSRVLEANVENLTISGIGDANGTGNALNNNMFGSFGVNLLIGGDGNDTLNGFFGDDTLIGGAGKDLLTGGSGDDEFRFNSLSDSTAASKTRDVVDGFDHGDKIDLFGIDANSKLAGNQAFTFHTNFTGHAGEVQFDHPAADKFVVSVDVNGDAKADFALTLFTGPGFGTLEASDFIL